VAREPPRFEQRRLRCRQSTPDASRRTRYHRSHRGHAGIGLPGLSSATASGAEPWRNCGVVRARRDHGGTQLAAGPARLRGLSRWGCRRPRRGLIEERRDRLVHRPSLAGQRAHAGGAAPRRPDVRAGEPWSRMRPAVAPSGRQPAPDLARQALPPGSTVGEHHAASAGPCSPAWWVGRSLATRPGR
jgi:hypothetical protein